MLWILKIQWIRGWFRVDSGLGSFIGLFHSPPQNLKERAMTKDVREGNAPAVGILCSFTVELRSL